MRRTPLQRGLTAAVVLSPLLYLACLALAGYIPWLWLVWFGWGLLLAPVVPDSEAPLIGMVGMVVCWAVGVDGTGGLLGLGAALSLLVFHVSAALLASAPPGAQLPRPILLRWGARTGVVAMATAAAWGAGQLFASGHQVPPLVRALAALGVAGAGLLAWLASRGSGAPAGQRGSGPSAG